jgi:hypothetical protein
MEWFILILLVLDVILMILAIFQLLRAKGLKAHEKAYIISLILIFPILAILYLNHRNKSRL